MPPSDDEILEKVRNGDSYRYAILVDRYKERGMTLALRMLRNREDAEEVLQDAFIRAYNGLDKFHGTAKFGTWFYRILYNACLTRLERRNKGAVLTSFEEEEGEPAIYTGSDPGILEDLDRKELVGSVKKILETLPEMYGAIVTMFYLQELSHEEICQITELPLGTVKIRLFRARAMLQERVARERILERNEI